MVSPAILSGKGGALPSEISLQNCAGYGALFRMRALIFSHQ
jgi:hypothetical protein